MLLTDPTYISYCILMLCATGLFWANATWISSYLFEHHGFSIKKMGALTAVPYVIAIISTFAGGWLMDKMGGKVKTVLLLSFLPSIPILVIMGQMPKGTGITSILIVLMLQGLFLNFYTGVIYAFAQVRYPKQVLGTAIGISNACGQFGAFCAPLAAGYLVVTSASGVSYTNVFIFLACLAAIAGVLTLFLKEKPLDIAAMKQA